MSVQFNIQQIKSRVSQAALRAGRNPHDVEIIAVTKQVELTQIEETLEMGITNLGENKVQELTAKINQLPGHINWHMIGRLQTNKVKYILDQVALIHSLDRWKLAEQINKLAEKRQISVQALVQVNVSGEKSKAGISVDEAKDFLESLADLPHLQIKGLMTILPHVVDPKELRPYFKTMRLLAEQLTADDLPGNINLKYLSMGMTGDFEVAVEEGANMIRIGSAIFGARCDLKGV